MWLSKLFLLVVASEEVDALWLLGLLELLQSDAWLHHLEKTISSAFVIGCGMNTTYSPRPCTKAFHLCPETKAVAALDMTWRMNFDKTSTRRCKLKTIASLFKVKPRKLIFRDNSLESTPRVSESLPMHAAHANSQAIHTENILKPTVWAESLFVFSFLLRLPNKLFSVVVRHFQSLPLLDLILSVAFDANVLRS